MILPQVQQTRGETIQRSSEENDVCFHWITTSLHFDARPGHPEFPRSLAGDLYVSWFSIGINGMRAICEVSTSSMTEIDGFFQFSAAVWSR